jgi:hypothetical protein
MFATTLRIAASALVAIAVLAFASMKNHHCITAALVPEPAWKAEFRRAYGLREGEVLNRVASPFPACRANYGKFLKKEFSFNHEFDKVTNTYRWDGKNVTWWSLTFDPDGYLLPHLLGNLGIPRQETEIDEAWRLRQIPGEFVLRSGAPVEKVVPRLEQILREELNLPVRLTLRQVEREVIVVGGKYESKPRANRKMNEVDLFAIKPNENDGAGGSGSFDDFLVAIGTHIDRRLVSDLANSPKDRIRWYYHRSPRPVREPDPNKDADGVLKNVTAQTALTFKTEKRKVRVLFVKSE